jgi:pSer/pThr/pTyr-binding forkhead associated (FHA) protein
MGGAPVVGKSLVDKMDEIYSRPLRNQQPKVVTATGAFLINKHTKERHELGQTVCKIGRDTTNNIALPKDSYVSRHHAWILQIKGAYWVEDLGSTNGSQLNGEVLRERKQIFNGDQLRFGRTDMTFEVS